MLRVGLACAPLLEGGAGGRIREPLYLAVSASQEENATVGFGNALPVPGLTTNTGSGMCLQIPNAQLHDFMGGTGEIL